MIIVRSLFDVEDDDSRLYNRDELSQYEINFLNIVEAIEIRIERARYENHTVLTYSIL